MATISICMIVKNEEAILARCLDSLVGLAEEIIIVDTGSTDRTKEIAAQYTDKIHDFKWINDFAAARNFSFSKATMDYIYVADADEVLDEENYCKFKTLKENLIDEIEIVQMYYGNQLKFNTTYNFDKEYRPKLYKRLREFHWMDAVHESVRLNPVVYDSDIVIEHRPTSNHAKRDFSVFQRILLKEGGLSPKLYQMYAKELFIAGEEKDFLEAKSYYEKMEREDSFEHISRKVCEAVLSYCYLIQKDTDKLMKISLKNIADGKGTAEVCYNIGEYFYQIGDYKEAIIWFYNASFETECELNVRYNGDLSLYRLANSFEQLGNIEESKRYEHLAMEWKINNQKLAE